MRPDDLQAILIFAVVFGIVWTIFWNIFTIWFMIRHIDGINRIGNELRLFRTEIKKRVIP